MNKIINKFFDEVSPLFFIGVLLVSSLALNAQDSEAEVEEIVVKGNVLYSDQVNALENTSSCIRCTSDCINSYR